MWMYDIIDKKRNKEVLTKAEIDYFVKAYTDGDIPDYQASALLMAICINGMSDEETFDLTNAMLHSGKIIDLSPIKGIKVDKHSTGGVGDKVSLVLGPMLAACGVKFAKMSGRGLGHTGGTLDKLESIPGFQVQLSTEKFIDQVTRIGLAIIGQSNEICLADKKLYALRDVTATVQAIPLIASSIMSKKLADGSDVQLLDVKYGSGAFMRNIDEATKLAKLMVEIGKRAGKKTCAEITNINQPLGMEVGNSNEVIEAINTLHGNGPKDLMEICYSSGSTLLIMAHVASNMETARKRLEEVIQNGMAFDCFCRMVEAQGGDVRFVKDTSLFPKATYNVDVKAVSDGFVKSMDAKTIGLVSCQIGGGREKEGDVIDHAAGITLKKKIGDKVHKGETIMVIHSDRPNLENAQRRLAHSFETSPIYPDMLPLIEKRID